MESDGTVDNGISGHGHGRRRHVLAMPFPGWGHMNPMMNVCELLATRGGGVLVTVVVTEEWLGLIGSAPKPPNLRFRTIPNTIPSEQSRGADIGGFIQAVFNNMEAPFEQLLERLEPPVDCIITDSFLRWTAEVACRRNIPVSSLWTQPTAVLLALCHLGQVKDKEQLTVDHKEKGNECLNYLPRVDPQRHNGSKESALLAVAELISWLNKAQQSLLLTSFYELEASITDALKSQLPCPVYSLGPSIPYMSLKGGTTNTEEDYYKWLDSQPSSSVLYVSLGSVVLVPGPQMDQIAMGLRDSGVRFLWAARGDSSRVKEMSGGMGIVVPWCDQLKVLCHPSVGGFFTHCGWNSTLEGVFAGVPMLTFPLIWDQHPNSKLVVDDWKVGLRVKREEVVGEGNVVGKEEIAMAVKKLMVDLDGDVSRELRRRARELRETCLRVVQEGGSSSTNADAFIRDCLQGLC